MYGHFEDFKQSLEYSNKELSSCKEEVAELKTQITDMKAEVTLLKSNKEELKAQCQLLTEGQITIELQMREQNLLFDGIVETYGENPSLLYKKVVSVLDHMMIFSGNCGMVPFTKIQRLGPYTRG